MLEEEKQSMEKLPGFIRKKREREREYRTYSTGSEITGLGDRCSNYSARKVINEWEL